MKVKKKKTIAQLQEQINKQKALIPEEPMTLRAWCEACHITVTELARLLGLNRMTISCYMSGSRKPSIKSFNKIAVLTDCRVRNFEYLVDEK